MTANNTISCGVPDWFGSPTSGDPDAWINEFLVIAVNLPFCAFSFLSNLAIIITIIKTPSLHRPCNTLLCCLAATDGLTGVTSQPIFVTLRLILLYRDNTTCGNQEKLFTAFYACIMLTSGWSFVFLCVISFDRHYALSRPLMYRTRVSNKGALTIIALTGASWFFLTLCVLFVFPRVGGLIFGMAVTAIFIVVPIVNHIRMFFAFRRHNKLILAEGVTEIQQLSIALQREKKIAFDMAVISLILLLSLAPSLLNRIIISSVSMDVFAVLQPWTITMVFLSSSLNPIVYIRRNIRLRNAVRYVIFASNT
ncbi:melanocortin receptor 3-like [Montipora foliosa]|uniref:melanocortin receptor 3-like n=1 Tax=Montipora foliosa TaxID=591990 RepID=UPI0035F14E60